MSKKFWVLVVVGLFSLEARFSGASRAQPPAPGRNQSAQSARKPDPEHIAQLADRLASQDFGERTAAIAAVEKIIALYAGGDMQVFSPLVSPLFSRTRWGGEARRNAAMAKRLLLRIGKPAVPLLLEKLKSPEARDRWCAIEVLARIGEPEAPVVTAVRPLLADKDSYVRRFAIEALGQQDEKARPAIEDLQAMTNDPLPNNQIRVHAALIRITGKTGNHVEAIARHLESPDAVDYEAAFAASTLGGLGTAAKSAEPQLRNALNHPIGQARVNAAAALGRIGADSDETITVLIDKLRNDPSREVRRSAAVSLGMIGPKAKSAIPALRDALPGGTGWWVAARSLGQIGSPAVVPILEEALEHKNADIRLAATRALGDLGSLAMPAMPTLKKRLKDSSERVRKAAAAALEKIECDGEEGAAAVKKRNRLPSQGMESDVAHGGS